MKRKSAALLTVAAILLNILPEMGIASVTSELYTVDGGEITNVYPETFVSDFKSNIISDEDVKEE